MTDAANKTDVTILGLGAMGTAFARTLIKAGKRVTVWNRTPSKAEGLVREGALVAPHVEAAISASPLTIIILLDHCAIGEILSDKVLAASAKRTLVDLTTGTEAEIREVAARARDAGIPFVSGAALTYPRSIGDDDAAILYSGDTEAFEEHKPLLQYLGGALRYLGSDPTSAQMVSYALVTLSFSALGGFLEAAAWAETKGISLTTISESARSLSLPFLNDSIADLAKRIPSSAHGGEQATVDVHVAAFETILTEIQRAGVGSRCFQGVNEYVKTAQSIGLGSKGFSAVYDVVRYNRS